jgi:hypothetical protein
MSSSNFKFATSFTFLILLLALVAYYANEESKRNHELSMARLQNEGSDSNPEPIAKRTPIGFNRNPTE